MLFEAGCDGAVMLEFVEEPFDQVAAFVEARAEGWRVDAMTERSDIGCCALGDDHGAQSIAVVTAIRQKDALARQSAEHVFAPLAVVRLALGQLERDREAAGVDERVDFGRKPAAGTAHATASTTFFSPVAAC